MSADVVANLKNQVFFHGTSLEAAERIAQEGLKAAGGNLGAGSYVSCDWRVSLWFGSTLLRVTIDSATRLLDSTVPPDASVLQYLQREFGREILNKPPWKAIPRNKKLKLTELITLFRHHYQRTWMKPNRLRLDPGRRRWAIDAQLLDQFRSALIRYGFHGYGDPWDTNGIVLFSDDRIELVEVVADLPEVRHSSYWEDESRQFKSIDQIRRHFRAHGTERAKKLAKLVAESKNE